MASLSFWIFLRFWFPVFAYSGIIFWVSSWQNLKAPLETYGFDKIVHGLEYLLFGLLLARALLHSYSRFNRSTLVTLVLVCSFLYGLSDEYHQSFVIGRTADAFDLLADTIGGFIGGWIYLRYNTKA